MRTIKHILILAVVLLPLQGFCAIRLQKKRMGIVNAAGQRKQALYIIHNRIGLSAASPGDLSDPGMVLQVRMKE